jgi:hypothetical protein
MALLSLMMKGLAGGGGNDDDAAALIVENSRLSCWA